MKYQFVFETLTQHSLDFYFRILCIRMDETKENDAYEEELLDYEEEDEKVTDSVNAKVNGESAKKSVHIRF